jgi:uncharacterized protein (DUF983 family)
MTKVEHIWTNRVDSAAKRDLKQAMWRGFRGRCPSCGEGNLFRAYLKTSDACAVCGQDLHHHRADDFPAYLVIVIVGHIIVPLVLAVEQNFAPSYLVHLAVWLPLTLGMSLALLQPVKGAIVGLQWAFRMHGFDENGPADPLETGLREKKT